MRRTVTIMWALLLTVFIASISYSQNKADIRNLLERYYNGEQLTKSEMEVISQDILANELDKSKQYVKSNGSKTAVLDEGFESGSIPTDWTVLNEDGDSYQWEVSTDAARTGSYGAQVHYNGSGNDDWLITKQVSVIDGSTLTFYAKSRSSSFLEDFNVKVSKTGTNASDFTITIASVTEVPNSWTEYSYVLTDNANISDGDNIYIAIQCVSVDEYYLYVDDILVDNPTATTPGQPTNPNPTDGATDVAYTSGTLTWDFGANTDLYSLEFGPSGNMSEVVTDAAAGASGSYSYSNLEYGKEYQWRVTAKNSTTGETTAGAVWSFTTALKTDMYQVGNGNNTGEHLPIEPYYGYTYSQSLYLASDLSGVGSNKRISKIYYNYHKASSGDHDADDWVVYLGTTNDNTITDWVPVTNLTKVFDGNSGYGDIATGDGWMEIILDTPFNYNPSTDGNLIVAVDENTSSYTSSSDDFYCDQNTTKANVSIFYYSDGTNPDPASPPSGTTSSYYPNIRFQFEDIPAEPQFSVNPESKDFGTVYLGESSSDQTFTVTNTGQGTLQITATSIVGTNAGDFTLTDANTYPVDLGNGETMTVQVKFSPSAEGARSATLRFTANAKVDHDVALSGNGHDPTVTSYPYNENFDAAASLPTDWQQDPNNEEDWKFGSSASYAASSDHTSGSGNIAWVDDSAPHTTSPINLLTPPFDLTGLTKPTVSFYYWIGRNNNRDSQLHIDVYDGTTWHEDVISSLGENGQWNKVSIDITSYKSSGTKIRFRAIEDPDDYDSDIAIDDFRMGEPVAKYINSITVSQASTDNILVGSTDKEILKLEFQVEGDVGNLPLNSITVTGANDNDNDVSSVKLYRTATSTFATDNLVATGTLAKGAVTFSGINYDLPIGNTYFWVTYDIASSATVGNKVDAKILANGIDVNGTTYNSADDDPTGERTISGIALSAVTVTQASTSNVNVGSTDNEILRIYIDTEESTTSGGENVSFTNLSVTTKNSDDNDVSSVKLYRTTGTTFNTDNLVATGTIGKGHVNFDLTENLTSDMYYWITYDISGSATDDNTVDALIPANGMTISGSTYNSADDDPAGERRIKNYNHGGDGTAYGGYYFANSTPNGGNNRPEFQWRDITTHTEITSWTSGSDDDGYFKAPIGFSFSFFGNSYDSCYIGTNGVIAFGSGYSGTGSTAEIPSTSTPNNMIAVCLMDLDDRSDGKIYYGTSGGNFVVTWWHYHDYSDDAEYITAQAELKRNGNIKIQYYRVESAFDMSGGSSTILGDALVGIENSDGTDGHEYRNNGVGGPMIDNTKADGLAVEYSTSENATPVELSSFVATPNEEGIVTLKWKTATEVNTAMFEVERAVASDEQSEDEWLTIGSVEASGNSNAPKEYSFKDELSHSGTYKYRLKIVDLDGSFKYSSIVNVTANIVLKYELSQNYPNPFNPTTTIKFSIKKSGKVKLAVYNALGQQVALLVNQEMDAGKYKINFDASKLASGVYFYRIQSGKFVSVKKMMLIK